MINFLEETQSAILGSGHTPAEVIFIGSTTSGHACTWDEFVKLADFDYDAGFGCASIPSDLTIVFSDESSMWRGEYDGSEWWEHGVPFNPPETTLPITSLYNGDMWPTLQDVNTPGGKYGKAEKL